jgi:hypothetical protein
LETWQPVDLFYKRLQVQVPSSPVASAIPIPIHCLKLQQMKTTRNDAAS